MAITPQEGYKIDPNNPNGVVPIDSDVINSNSLSPTGSLNLPDLPQSNPQEIIGAIPTIESLISEANRPSQQENLQGDFRSEILSSLNTVAGKRGATLEAENAAGIPAQQKQLQEYSNRLLALRNESLAIPLQVQEQFTGTGATVGGAEPIQTSKLRKNAIESLALSAQAQAIQGNLSLAQQQVDRAIELQFEPEERKLEFLRQAYEFNREDLERVDKKRADALNIQLNERARLIETQKADATAVRNTANLAAKNGADQSTIKRILESNDPDVALALAGTFLRDPLDVAQLAKIKQDMYYDRLKAEAELNPTSVTTDGTIQSVSELLSTNKVGQTTKTLIGTIFGVLNAAEDMAVNSGGVFKGINPFNVLVDRIPFRNALRQKEGTENLGYINGINLKIQQWASGAALTEKQTEQVEKMTPNKNDTDEQVKTKLNNLSNFMMQQVKGSLQSEGIDFEPEEIDLFAPKTLEGIFK